MSKNHMKVKVKNLSLKSYIVNTATEYGPFLAPLPAAYFIADASVTHLFSPQWVAIVIGTTIELVGIAAINNLMIVSGWNRGKAKKYQIPIVIAIIPVITYLLVGITLAVLLEMIPTLAPLAPSLFFLLAGAAYIVLATSQEIEQKKLNYNKPKKETLKVDKVVDISVDKKEHQSGKVQIRQRELKTLYHEGMTNVSELAGHFNVSQKTIRRDKKEMSLNGASRKEKHNV